MWSSNKQNIRQHTQTRKALNIMFLVWLAVAATKHHHKVISFARFLPPQGQYIIIIFKRTMRGGWDHIVNLNRTHRSSGQPNVYALNITLHIYLANDCIWTHFKIEAFSALHWFRLKRNYIKRDHISIYDHCDAYTRLCLFSIFVSMKQRQCKCMQWNYSYCSANCHPLFTSSV